MYRWVKAWLDLWVCQRLCRLHLWDDRYEDTIFVFIVNWIGKPLYFILLVQIDWYICLQHLTHHVPAAHARMVHCAYLRADLTHTCVAAKLDLKEATVKRVSQNIGWEKVINWCHHDQCQMLLLYLHGETVF